MGCQFEQQNSANFGKKLSPLSLKSSLGAYMALGALAEVHSVQEKTKRVWQPGLAGAD